MSEPQEICVRIVKLAFTKLEYDVLVTHKDFVSALNECKSTDDIDRVCVMGQRLLDYRQKSTT
jgi:hypothetical protein